MLNLKMFLTLFILSAGWLFFAYAGYPLILWLLRSLSPRPVIKGSQEPALTIIIPVHNGANQIAEKLENTLSLEYSGPKQVIVSSDGSSDETVMIANRFADRGVLVLDNPRRSGKEAAQALALTMTTTDLVVSTDVGALLEPGAVRSIVRAFADPSVGCVSSEDVVESGDGEGLYVRYEMLLRRLESEVGALVGVSGSFFAFRRSLADPWPEDLASDFRVALEAARRGLRAVSEPDSRARIRTAQDATSEWQRKIRTVRRGLAVLTAYRQLLSPRFGRVALTLWGHKAARFTSPFALLFLLVISALGALESGWFLAALMAQVAGYALAWAALASERVSAFRIPRLAGFFLIVNVSILAAWFHHLFRDRAVVWDPTRR